MKLITKNYYLFFLITMGLFYSCAKEELRTTKETSIDYNLKQVQYEQILLEELRDFDCLNGSKMVFSSDQVTTTNNTYYRFKWLNCGASRGPFEAKLLLLGEEGFVCGNNTSTGGSINHSEYFDWCDLSTSDEFLLSHQTIGKKGLSMENCIVS